MNVSTHNYRCSSLRRSSGFTLVELLVVISIIGVLIGMLMPAVNAARESANRASCSNNIRQLALACLNYDQSWKALPCGLTYTGTLKAVYNSGGSAFQPQPSNQRHNWVIMILPFIEQASLFNNFVEKFEEGNTSHDNATPISDARFEHLREIELPVMKCPTDANNRIPYMDGSDKKWARGNYGANMGLTLADNLVQDSGNTPWWNNTGARGVMGPQHSVTIGEISDGASNTIMLAELRSGLTAKDCRGTWAMGGAGPSAICRNGYICGDDNGPNYLVNGADDIIGCPWGLSSTDTMRLKMPCTNGNNREATTRSMHQAGVTVAFADNSVRFISDNIQTRSSFSEDYNNVKNNTEFSVWDCINLSSDGKSIDNADF